jgi:hypothetical protein
VGAGESEENVVVIRGEGMAERAKEEDSEEEIANKGIKSNAL